MSFPCPCCGYLVHVEAPGSYDICPICDWEDDPVQLRWPDFSGGANHPSLLDAQRNFATIGASDPTCRDRVRPPTVKDRRELGFHAIMDGSCFEPRGVKDAPWPSDPTLLYWWRPSFWRRKS